MPVSYHLYREDEVREDLNRKAEAHEPLPALVQNAYTLLAHDWRDTRRAWQAEGHTIPPVLLTVCNRTETAARIERFFNEGDCIIDDTQAPARTLRVVSKVLEKAERGESATKDKAYAARLATLIEASPLPSDKQADLLARSKKSNCGRWSIPSASAASPARICRMSFRWPCSPKAGMPRTSPTSWACAHSPASCCASR
jgi:type III restriction enzyme